MDIWKDDEFLFENITISDDEQFCEEIGFEKGTAVFDKCVRESSKR